MIKLRQVKNKIIGQGGCPKILAYFNVNVLLAPHIFFFFGVCLI
jgi:hypothetical protein